MKNATIDSGVVITNYDQLRIDESIFVGVKWFYVILDEAQKIKHSET
jgi:SNF2 family DNA or RNA helicase